MTVVIMLGLFASVFISPDNTAVVSAEVAAIADIPVVELRTSSPRVVKSNLEALTGNSYQDQGSWGDTSDYVSYSYYLDGTETANIVTGTTIGGKDLGDNTTHTYYIKETYNTYTGKKWYVPQYTKSETIVAQGDFLVSLYSHLNLTVNTDAIDNGATPSVAVSGVEALDADSYKVYYNGSATISFDTVEDFYVTINDEIVEGNTYTISNITTDQDITVEYLKSTDCNITVDADTITGATLQINDTTISRWSNELTVAEGETITIVATANSGYAVKAINCNGAILENTAEYPNYTSTYTVGSGEDYTITLDVIYTNCDITVDTDTTTGATLQVNETTISWLRKSVTVAEGSVVTINATADSGYIINAINCNGTILENTAEYPNYTSTFTVGSGEEYTITLDITDTNCEFIVDTDTMSGTTLKINGETVSALNKSVKVSAGETITIDATPDNKHLINAIKCNGVVLENVAEYPNFSATYTVGIAEEYNITLELVEATNTITCAKDGGEVKVSGQLLNQSLNSTLPRDTEVTIILNPNDNEYVVDYTLENITNETVTYDKGTINITFTTGVNENYVVDFVTATMFTAKENDVEINMYDVLLMHQGDSMYKAVTYSTIFDNVYTNYTNLTADDVNFEYLAGIYTIDAGLLGSYDVELWFPVEKASAATQDEVKAYIAERYGSVVANLVNGDMALDILSRLHRFGELETETIKLIFAGNDSYSAANVIGTVKAVDLREFVDLDINEEISVVYGSYVDNVHIMDMILADRNGVVSKDGAVLTELVTELYLEVSLVGENVGTYSINVKFNSGNYFYRAESKVVTVTITKANVKVDVVNNILNYEVTSNNGIVKNDIVTITPDVLLEDKTVDHVYFVMGLDVVKEELIVNVDLTNIKSYPTQLEQTIIDTAIKAALKVADPEDDGLTLAEFVDFALTLSEILSADGLEIDTTYIDKLTELLAQADETINVRISVIYGNDINIVPQNPGVYLVGAVTTDANYNIGADAGYLVITPDIIDVKFEDANNNNLRKFDFDGTPKQMIAEAYDYDEQVAEGNMYYYYVGMQLNGEFYASVEAPIHTGSYSVFALFSNSNEGVPTKVGVAVGAMVIVPCGDVQIITNDVTVCENGEEHNIDYAVEEGASHILAVMNDNVINIILPASWNINLEDDYALVEDKITTISNKLEAILPDYYITELKAQIQNIIDEYNIKIIVVNKSLPITAGEYAIAVVAVKFDYEITVAEAILTINPHDTVYHEGKLATCTEYGWNEYYTCNNCDYTTYTEIDALGHTADVDVAVEATCTATGLTEGSHCSVCNEVLLEQEVTEKKAHTASGWITINSATCITKGSAHIVCTECNLELDIKELDFVDHTLEYNEGKSATCTEAGYTAYHTCSVDGCEYNTKEVIDALGHTEVIDTAVESTCTATGLTEGSHCSVCNEVLLEQEVTEKKAHTPGIWTTEREATCTIKGIENQLCTVCQTVLNTRDIEVVDHVREFHIGQSATCTVAGWTDYETCENCAHNTKVIISALGHTEVIDTAVESTCTTTGLTEGRHCSVCNEVLLAQQVLPMVEHTYGHWFVGLTATATSNGYYARVCSVCEYEDRQEIEAYGDKNVGGITVTIGNDGKVVIDEGSVSQAVKDLEETGKKEIVISTTSETPFTSINLSATSLQQIMSVDSVLTIETSSLSATFDQNTLSTIMQNIGSENTFEISLKTIKVEELNEAQRNSVNGLKIAEVVRAEIYSGDNVISNFGDGKVQVKIPFVINEDKTIDDYKFAYIAEDGSIEEISATYIDGEMVVELGHFSEYVIIDISKNDKLSVASIVALSILTALALFAGIGTIVLVKKEKKR